MNQGPYQPSSDQNWPPQEQPPYDYGQLFQPLPPNTQWGQQQPYAPQYAQTEHYVQPGVYYWPPAITMQLQEQWQPIPIPPPPPPIKKPGTHPFVVALLLIFMIFALIGVTVSMSESLSPPTNGGGPSPATGTWTTTQSFTGNGIQKTAYFSVSSDWKILWTCDPSSFLGKSYNVQVFVSGDVQDVAINTLCQSENTSGETEEHSGGQIYLTINSEAAWTIQIQELQ